LTSQPIEICERVGTAIAISLSIIFADYSHLQLAYQIKPV